MAMTFTIDPRPTVIGNLLLVTGTYDDAASDRAGDLLLSDYFSKLLHVDISPFTDATATAVIHSEGQPLAMSIACAATEKGRWLALGIRG